MIQSGKICVVCGADCSSAVRYKSPGSGYICHHCYTQIQEPATSAVPTSRLRVSGTAAVVQPEIQASRGIPSTSARSSFKFSSDSPLVVGGAALLAFVLLLLLTRVAVVFGYIYFAAYALLVIGVGMAVIIGAFRTSVVQGLLTCFVPFYSIYYIYGVSRNRLLMTLTPLCMVLWVGVFFLPKRETTAVPAEAQTESVSGQKPTRRAITSSSARSEKTLAGHLVVVTPRGGNSSYAKGSSGKQITINQDGKKITLKADRPIHFEQWKISNQNIIVANGELIVNYQTYGVLNSGAEVLIDHGAVFISGEPAIEKPGTVSVTVSP